MIVKFQYLSAFLQLQSLFNHIGYLTNFLERLTKTYPAEQAWYTALIVGELVSDYAHPHLDIAFSLMVGVRAVCVRDTGHRPDHPNPPDFHHLADEANVL